MLKIFILCALWLPLLSFAFPNKGDYVRYEAKYDGDVVVMERTILNYYPERDSFLIGYLVTYRGKELEKVVYDTPKSFLYDEAKVANVLKTCVEREGAISIVDIMNKKITVCEFYNEDSMLTTMIGGVPFGQVRFQVYLEGEEFLDFYLVKFNAP